MRYLHMALALLILVVLFAMIVINQENEKIYQQSAACVERGGAAVVDVGGVFACVQKLETGTSKEN